MAVSQIQFRSISLPSRLHPINSTGFESELKKLRSSSSSSSKTVPFSSETIQCGILGLAELYNSIGEQSHALKNHHQDGKAIEESLEGSIEILDCCSSIRELVQMIKENVQSLQSALRRKGGVDSTIHNDVSSYLCFRKKMNKSISKGLKTLKNLENKNASPSNNIIGGGDHEDFIRALREVSDLTTAIFKSALVYLSSPTTVKSGGWNLVSKLMVTKSSADCNNVVSEVGCVDIALKNLQVCVRNGDSKVVDVQTVVQRSLTNLDSCVQGIEDGLEKLFRQLLQSRVTLLNILTDH